jgi:hypothetical protein
MLYSPYAPSHYGLKAQRNEKVIHNHTVNLRKIHHWSPRMSNSKACVLR